MDSEKIKKIREIESLTSEISYNSNIINWIDACLSDYNLNRKTGERKSIQFSIDAYYPDDTKNLDVSSVMEGGKHDLILAKFYAEILKKDNKELELTVKNLIKQL